MNRDEVYEQNFSRLYRYFFYRDVRQADVEDLVQETFIRLYNKYSCEKLDALGATKLLYTIAGFVYKEWLHNPINYAIQELEEDFPSHFEVAEFLEINDEISEDIDDNTCRQRLREAIAQLSPSLRPVVELRFLEGLTRQETAVRLNMKVNDVYTYQKRAIKTLQKALSVPPTA